jgi:UDP-N-acetylglucosamine 2-epimerase
VKKIVEEVSCLEERKRPPRRAEMFGDGRASERIVKIFSRMATSF